MNSLKLSENSQQGPCRFRQMGKKQGASEIQTEGNVIAQMAAMDKKIDMIIKVMDSNSMQGQTSKEVGQIANALSKREDGKFPSQTEINPKSHEHLKAITTLTKELEKAYKRMRQNGRVIDNKMGQNEDTKNGDIEAQDRARQNEILM
ncbi:hypothetical protein AAC387_Pa02g2131 [Persea americana]